MHIELLSPAQTIPMGISIHFVNQYSISFKTVVGLDELKRCSYYTTSERQDVILTHQIDTSIQLTILFFTFSRICSGILSA